MALVSVVIDNSGTTYCNGQLLGVANAWNKADTYTCNAIDNNYIIAIDGVDGEVSRQGVGGMMATVVADNGEVMNSDASWRCWNAEGHRNSQPPANWMEYDFDDSSWPNAASYGRNDGGQTHWAAYIPMQPGYPPTAGHVKPGIADNAEWIWTADPETHNDVYCRGNFYNGGRLPTVAPPPPPVYGSIPPSSSVAMVSVVVDNSGSTYCNGQLLGNENAWNMADTWKCVAVNNDYVIAIDGVDGEVCPGQVCGVGGLMATIVADNGEVLNTDTTWKCWNAEGHRDTQPPGNWMEVDFDDSLWPNAASYGRNDGDETHWAAYIPMPIGYPATAGHVKPGIADNAEWIWSADPETHNDVYCRGKFHRSTMGVQVQGPLDCYSIQLSAATHGVANCDNNCNNFRGAPTECIQGITQAQLLWSDRDYAWQTAPADILSGGWTYVRVPLETGSGAPCATEGGFQGSIQTQATVAVCCANHCGSINTPVGVTANWSPHPGSYTITQHDGSPCTFYETRLQAGVYNICCKSCWASGLFLAVPSESHLSYQNGQMVNTAHGSAISASSAGAGGMRCDNECNQFNGGQATECTAATRGAALWSDRAYTWDTAPADILTGGWSYVVRVISSSLPPRPSSILHLPQRRQARH